MTWLPIATEATTERDAVLGLHPEAYAFHRAFLQQGVEVTDPELLEPCRARIAQVLGCREELARHSSERLAAVEAWVDSPSLTDAQRAAIAFVEQFLLDPALVTPELVRDLEAHLGTGGVIDFAAVISAHEASIRLSTLLDLGAAR